MIPVCLGAYTQKNWVVKEWGRILSVVVKG